MEGECAILKQSDLTAMDPYLDCRAVSDREL